MEGEVKLNELTDVLARLDYPVSKDDAKDQVKDVLVVYSEGEEPLSEIIARSEVNRFQDQDDLESEVMSNVAMEAVGEPGQSEGEG